MDPMNASSNQTADNFWIMGPMLWWPVSGCHPYDSMVAIVKWLRPWIVIPLYVGSNPTSHPKYCALSSVGSECNATNVEVGGSNPSGRAKHTR